MDCFSRAHHVVISSSLWCQCERHQATALLGTALVCAAWATVQLAWAFLSPGEEAEPCIKDADSPRLYICQHRVCIFWSGDIECVYLDLMMSTFRGLHHGRLRRLIKPRSGSSWTAIQMFPLALSFTGSIHGGLWGAHQRPLCSLCLEHGFHRQLPAACKNRFAKPHIINQNTISKC